MRLTLVIFVGAKCVQFEVEMLFRVWPLGGAVFLPVSRNGCVRVRDPGGHVVLGCVTRYDSNSVTLFVLREGVKL